MTFQDNCNFGLVRPLKTRQLGKNKQKEVICVNYETLALLDCKIIWKEP